MITTDLPCAVCDKELEALDGDTTAPYGANIFSTHGHYGATAYDSFMGENLEILICTECMDTMQKKNAIIRELHATEEIPYSRNLWKSENDPQDDNPKNKLRLSNESRMDAFFERNFENLSSDDQVRIFKECSQASLDGKVFNPKI